MTDDLRTSYDELPYHSHAYPQSHPDHLWVMAKLFGMTPASLERCRVLELGCASGGNIIPMAAGMPDAQFVGIDLAASQTEAGNARIAELGLTNVELRAGDLTEIADSLPEFDYIIAHGLFSWVPVQVQEAILRIFSTKLARNGVAYVSYNTYPGWRARGTLRDLMLYHVRQFKDVPTRVAQGRALLDFMAQSVPDDKSAFSQLLRSEVETLRGQPDSYLYHDFLESFNQPLYFHQFAERAAGHKLQYLGESELATMLPGNFSPTVRDTLRKIAPDLIRTEQFMDFLRNRQFRQTLLVHADVPLNRNIDARVLDDLEVACLAQPVSLPVDEASQERVEFKLPTGPTMATSSPITKAAFVLMRLRWPLSAPFRELCAAARARLSPPLAKPDPAQAAEDAKVLGHELLQCAVAGIVELRARSFAIQLEVPARPEAYAVARAEARTRSLVTNLRHESISLDEFNRQLLLRLDGEHDVAMLVDEFAGLVADNTLSIKQSGVEVRDPASVREVMRNAVPEALAGLARAALIPKP